MALSTTLTQARGIVSPPTEIGHTWHFNPYSVANISSSRGELCLELCPVGIRRLDSHRIVHLYLRVLFVFLSQDVGATTSTS